MRKVMAFVLVACMATVVKTDIIQLTNDPETSEPLGNVTIQYEPEKFVGEIRVTSGTVTSTENEYNLGVSEQGKVTLKLHDTASVMHGPIYYLRSIDIGARGESYEVITLKFRDNLHVYSKRPSNVVRIYATLIAVEKRDDPSPESTMRRFADTMRSETKQKVIELAALRTILDSLSSGNTARMFTFGRDIGYSKRGYSVTTKTALQYFR